MQLLQQKGGQAPVGLQACAANNACVIMVDAKGATTP
jgi:hypothetical protein